MDLALRFLGHSTVRVEPAGRVVLTGPVLTSRVGPRRRVGPATRRAAWADADPVMHRLGRLDVALLPVRGRGRTLGPGRPDPARAAEAVARLRPRVAVPVHGGSPTLAGPTRAPGRHGVRMRRLLVEPAHRFAATAAAAGSATRVVVTEAGHRVPLPVVR